MKNLNFKPGFTMIELLVVIAVIGILAAAVLSAINPIEQINKGRDTRARADATSLVQAADRYFAIQEYYPWNIAGTTYTPSGAVLNAPEEPFTSGFNGAGTALTSFTWIENLVSTDEIKDGFSDRVLDYSSGLLFIKPDGANASAVACFIPQSTAFKQQAADACNSSTGNQDAAIESITICATVNGTINNANFICVQ